MKKYHRMIMFEIKTKWLKYFRRLRLESILANCTTLTLAKKLLVNKKSPRGIRPCCCSPPPPPPGGVRYVTVTQDKSPCLCSERHDEYLFGRAKTGGLGQVTTKKKNHGKKMGIIRPRPDGGVITKTQLRDKQLCIPSIIFKCTNNRDKL